MSERRPARFDTLAGVVALGVGIWIFLGTLWLIIRAWSPVLLHDQWDNLISGRAVTWQWLVSQNYGVDHRLFFPRLIFIADYWLARETNLVNFAISPLLQLGLVVVLLRLARSAGFATRAQLAFAGGLALALMFWAAQHENYIWGFQSQFFLVQLAAVGALALARDPVALTAVALGWGIGAGTNWVLSHAALQRHATDAVIGRLAAFDELLVTAAMVASAFVGALVADASGEDAAALTGVGLGLLGLVLAALVITRASALTAARSRP